MNFIEFKTIIDGVVLIRMENITLVKKNPREYPKFQTTYSVFVNNRNWTLSEDEGEVVYKQYKDWLMSEQAGSIESRRNNAVDTRTIGV